MKKPVIALFVSLIILMMGILLPTMSRAEIPPEINSKPMPSLSPMLKKVMPAVVNISVVGVLSGPQNILPDRLPGRMQRHRPGLPNLNNGTDDNNNYANNNSGQGTKSRKFLELGSGVIVNAQKGYIITNYHVIHHAKTITVTLDDTHQVKAKVVGFDKPSDIAVLQIKAGSLTALPLANSNDLKVGDFVVAIGNPFGLSQTVTSGIVSGLQRANLGIEGFENFIQTDASINPGNSGGALVNLKGQLVGMNTAIVTPDGGNIGIGFAIPADMVKSVMDQIIKYGSVRRGLMGIMVQTLTPGLAEAFNQTKAKGALVSQVSAGSPAAKAGFKPGDIIVNINGEKIQNGAQVTNAVGMLRAGSEIHTTVLRNGKPINLTVTTASPKQYQKESQASNPLLYGVNLRDYDQTTSLHGLVQGVQVTGVSQISPAWQAMPVGLRPGDVIISADLKPVRNTKELINIARHSNHLLLNVYRRNMAMFVVIK